MVHCQLKSMKHTREQSSLRRLKVLYVCQNIHGEGKLNADIRLPKHHRQLSVPSTQRRNFSDSRNHRPVPSTRREYISDCTALKFNGEIQLITLRNTSMEL